MCVYNLQIIFRFHNSINIRILTIFNCFHSVHMFTLVITKAHPFFLLYFVLHDTSNKRKHLALKIWNLKLFVANKIWRPKLWRKIMEAFNGLFDNCYFVLWFEPFFFKFQTAEFMISFYETLKHEQILSYC